MISVVKGPKRVRWLEPCDKCGKKHLWELRECLGCNVHMVAQTVSENACPPDQICDGCEAYQDHLC